MTASCELVLPVEPSELVRFLDGPDVQSIVLTGSLARGDAGPFSDLDIIRLVQDRARPAAKAESHLFHGRLLVVSDVALASVEEWFERPEVATEVMVGLRIAVPLLDRQGRFAAVRVRAQTFAWDDVMQARADAWASRAMAGWAEEIHKGLEGLRRNDVGRLLNARDGLTWGLTRVMRVHRGVLISGDNALVEEVAASVGNDSEWARLLRTAFGAAGAATLVERVIAGLRLYALTARMLDTALQPEDRAVVMNAVALIEKEQP